MIGEIGIQNVTSALLNLDAIGQGKNISECHVRCIDSSPENKAEDAF